MGGVVLRQPFQPVSRDEPVRADARELGQVVVAADLEIERVVAGRDLQRARAELHLDAHVRDHRHPAFDPRNDHLAADEVPVSLVVGMDGHGDIGRDGCRPHRCDRDEAVATDERVPDRRQRVVDVDMCQLEIRQRGLVGRAPVDDAVRPVDPASAIQVDEEPHHGADVRVVHREARAAVVERGAHPPELDEDLAAVLVQPLPDAFLEALAAELLTGRSLPRELLLDDVLRRDAGVVVARLEEHVEALHALEAHDGVTDGELERVAHVQLAGDVRGRMRIDIRRAGRVGVGVVEALLFPGALPALLDAARGVAGLHHRGTILRRLRREAVSVRPRSLACRERWRPRAPVRPPAAPR